MRERLAASRILLVDRLPPARAILTGILTRLGIPATSIHHAEHGQSALAQLAEHRYDLQYQLYSLALHRLLTLRLPGYDFEQHFGGVFYLFLRGMPQGGIFHTRPSRELVLGLDELFRNGDRSGGVSSTELNEVEA